MASSAQAMLAQRISGGGTSYLLQEDFEVNYSGPPPGWTVTGDAANYLFYDTSNPIVGVASLATQSTGNAVGTYKNFTATDDVWVFLAWRPVADGFGVFLRLQDGSGSDILTVWMWGTSAFALQGNGHTEFPSFSLSNGTPYYIWVHQTKGTGANGVTEFYVSTTTTKPGSPTFSWSDGTNTAQGGRLVLDNQNTGMKGMWDYARVADTVIGSAPS
jgi:hypothetical protein